MSIQTISKQNLTVARRYAASRQLEAWKKRNAKHLKNWNAVKVLRTWRDKR